MPIQHVKSEYLIPRGKVYFAPFDANEQLTGEFPLGNCPGLSLTINTEKTDHFSSETGLRQKDGSWVIQVDRTGTLQCDNFSPSNAALWLSGTLQKKTQAATPVTGELRTVIQGRQYQLGATAANPLGVRNVTAITVKNSAGTTPYVAGTDYNVDPETGRVQIIEGGGIATGSEVQFGYTPVAAAFESVKSGGKSELQGALRVVAAIVVDAAAEDAGEYDAQVDADDDAEAAARAVGDDAREDFSRLRLKLSCARGVGDAWNVSLSNLASSDLHRSIVAGGVSMDTPAGRTPPLPSRVLNTCPVHDQAGPEDDEALDAIGGLAPPHRLNVFTATLAPCTFGAALTAPHDIDLVRLNSAQNVQRGFAYFIKFERLDDCFDFLHSGFLLA